MTGRIYTRADSKFYTALAGIDLQSGQLWVRVHDPEGNVIVDQNTKVAHEDGAVVAASFDID